MELIKIGFDFTIYPKPRGFGITNFIDFTSAYMIDASFIQHEQNGTRMKQMRRIRTDKSCADLCIPCAIFPISGMIKY
jgi:hypothetical protein